MSNVRPLLAVITVIAAMLLSITGIGVWKFLQNGHFLVPANVMPPSSINVMTWIVFFNVIALPILVALILRLWFVIGREESRREQPSAA